MFAACTERGDCPLEEFLGSLGRQFESSLNGMMAMLDYVALRGPPRNMELSHQLRGAIYEFIKGRIRVFYFYGRGREIICTHGLVKKSQKTKSADIEYAEQVRLAFRTAVAAGKLKILNEEDNDT